jgi:ferredoxin
MAKLKVVDRDGQSHEISAQPGSNLMEILRNAGLEIEAICGGQCICSTCHVYISERWAEHLPARSDAEQVLVEDSGNFQENSRLSCQIDFSAELDGLSLTLAPEY